MLLLVSGLALFFIVHMIPLLRPDIKSDITAKIGVLPFKGIFSLVTLGGFVAIVLGWQSSEVSLIYAAPSWGLHVTHLFLLVGIILFIASNAPTNIKRVLRHPQLIGLSLWGIGHLFSNGESRSIVLFGGMVLFALTAIWASNKRDGEWVKKAPVSRVMDIVTVTIGLAVFATAAYFHQSFTGIPIL